TEPTGGRTGDGVGDPVSGEEAQTEGEPSEERGGPTVGAGVSGVSGYPWCEGPAEHHAGEPKASERHHSSDHKAEPGCKPRPRAEGAWDIYRWLGGLFLARPDPVGVPGTRRMDQTTIARLP